MRKMVSEKKIPAYYGYELKDISYAEYQKKEQAGAKKRLLFKNMSEFCGLFLESVCGFIKELFSPEVISLLVVISIVVYMLLVLV